MFIEQIIEFESWGPGPAGCTCNPKTGYFCDKTKIGKENLTGILLLNIFQKAMYLASFYVNQVNYKIYPKMLGFIRE